MTPIIMIYPEPIAFKFGQVKVIQALFQVMTRFDFCPKRTEYDPGITDFDRTVVNITDIVPNLQFKIKDRISYVKVAFVKLMVSRDDKCILPMG